MTAEAATAGTTALQHGIWMVGELVSTEPGREYDRKNGEKVTPGLVRMLVGNALEVIEYQSLADAQRAVGHATRGDGVMIRVNVRGTWIAGEGGQGGRRGRVSYTGWVDRD
jgi:hypothetical protein